LSIKKSGLLVLLLLAAFLSRAQSSSPLIGGRVMGLGYASACLKDEWAVFNNVAGLSEVKQSSAVFTYEAHPSFPSFNRMATAFAMPLGPGVAAVGVYRFGDELYNEQILSAAFANKLGIASLGAKINYIQYHTEGFGSARAIALSFGGIAQLTPVFSVGAHITNLNQPTLGKQTGEKLPTFLILGLGFRISDKIFITTEAEKDLSNPLLWKNGLEYLCNKKFSARTGFNLHPQAGFVGLGWKNGKFLLDYSFQYNLNLGACHQASVGYQFKTR
jgi:hypothetical protein